MRAARKFLLRWKVINYNYRPKHNTNNEKIYVNINLQLAAASTLQTAFCQERNFSRKIYSICSIAALKQP